MEYGLVGKIEREPFFIPLDVTAFEKIKDAKSALIECASIEETYDLLIENYLEFETALLDLVARQMVTRTLRDHESFSAARTILNRRLANLLSASRMYQDHVPHRLHRALKRSLKEELRRKRHEQYDNLLGYRCLEELRNHVQHCGLPVHSLTAEHAWTSPAEDGMLRFGITPHLEVEKLKSDPEVKATILGQIEEIGGRLDLKVAVRQYLEGLSIVHSYVRGLVAMRCADWEATLDDAIARLEELSEGRDLWLLAAVRVEDGRRVEELQLFKDFVGLRKRLEKKNEVPLTNLSRRFASSQVVGKG